MFIIFYHKLIVNNEILITRNRNANKYVHKLFIISSSEITHLRCAYTRMRMNRYTIEREKLRLRHFELLLSHLWHGRLLFLLIKLMAFYNRIKASRLIYVQVQTLKIILPSQNSVTLLQLLFFIGVRLFSSGI